MSRLDAFIRRMIAQRDCIEMAARLTSGVTGPVLEIGLGQGRTYHHLLLAFPEREVFVIDDRMATAEDIRPSAPLAILGDIRTVLPSLALSPNRFAVVHSDLGGSKWNDISADQILIECLSRWLPAITCTDAIVISNLPLTSSSLVPCPLPSNIRKDKIFVYQRISDTACQI